MQHKPTIELARLAIRSKICPICYQRPEGSETLGPMTPRSCEPGCTIFLSLSKLQPAATQSSLDAAPDQVMRQFVCPDCQSSTTAGDYCAEGFARTCPLSRYSGEVLEILEDLSRAAADPARVPPK